MFGYGGLFVKLMDMQLLINKLYELYMLTICIPSEKNPNIITSLNIGKAQFKGVVHCYY